MLLSRGGRAGRTASRDEQLNATYIVPSVFDPAVPTAVAAAVREAAAGAPERDRLPHRPTPRHLVPRACMPREW